MKFKKGIFLWLILAMMFLCVKTDAKILRLQSCKFNLESKGFNLCVPNFYSEIFMPYSEKDKTKYNIKNDVYSMCMFSHNPQLVMIVNNDNMTESESDFLINYEKKLMKSGMVMKTYDFSNKVSIFVKINTLLKFSKMFNNQIYDVLDYMAYKCYNRLQDFIDSPYDFIDKELRRTVVNCFVCRNDIKRN